jgi:hypothetical protein
MKVLLILLALFVAQQNSLQDRTVVHLRPHRNTIENDFGGKLLELINARLSSICRCLHRGWTLGATHGPSM